MSGIASNECAAGFSAGVLAIPSPSRYAATATAIKGLIVMAGSGICVLLTLVLVSVLAVLATAWLVFVVASAVASAGVRSCAVGTGLLITLTGAGWLAVTV